MSYPKGTKFGKWALYLEKQRDKRVWVIRRPVYIPDQKKPKLERLSPVKYRLWRDNPDELKKMVIRMNDRLTRQEKMRETVEIKHAYISPQFLDEYFGMLLTQIPDRNKATTEFYYVKTYFLDFFVNKLHLFDPLQWHLVQKTKWAEYLLSSKVPRSAFTKKSIVNAANRFMLYLHEQRPTEVPPLKFQPLTKATYKTIEARRKLKGEVRERKFIKDSDWKTISKKLPDRIAPFVLLSYHFGLRRAESMGLQLKDVKKGYLSVERQLEKFTNEVPSYEPPKGKKPRKVPYWYADSLKAYNWIADAQKQLMHPSTLSDRWAVFIKDLGMDYDFHDLRHTWITKAHRVSGVLPVDVMRAAGHQDIQTTMGYTHDDRELNDEIFVPDAS